MLATRIADRISVALSRRHADRASLDNLTLAVADLGAALARLDREAGEREAACRRRLTMHLEEHHVHANVGLKETT